MNRNYSVDVDLRNRTQITLIRRINTDFYKIICKGCFE